jgi:carbamoyltransferase
MYTLGINAVYHDSAACLVKDGRVVAAAEEERFTGIKHGKRPVPFLTYELPFHAIDFCLKEEGIELCDIDHVAYSYDPQLFSSLSTQKTITLPMDMSSVTDLSSVWDPLFVLYIKHAPRFLIDGAPHHIAKRFTRNNKFQWHFVPHHLAHAASAFLPSPFQKAVVLTLDGRGEKATTSYYLGNGINMNLLGEVNMPHSLGILYEKVTSYLGFLHSSDEYKVMALASYGQPKYLSDFRELIQIEDNGQYAIASMDFENMFGPARQKGDPFTSYHFDIAESLQKALEESVLKLCHWLYERTKEENLCLAGGVALNCVMNARLRDQGPFKKIWVQPAAGDAGTALGAAMWIDATKRQNAQRNYQMENVYLGPEFDDETIENFLKWAKISYQRLNDVAKETAKILSENKVIGWFQGRMEFGPRALGARSILASPIQAEMQQRLNEIKDREDFRPVAPVVLEEEADEWFINASHSPFMLFVYDVQPQKIDLIPAVCHVDQTARIQTVREEQNPLYYRLLKEFQELTEVPILVNTSFNTQGKPIVCTPRDAIECFWSSPLDCLVIGSFLLNKEGSKDESVRSYTHFQPAEIA